MYKLLTNKFARSFAALRMIAAGSRFVDARKA
jgi:hypothetical protein